jgi:hypothetical protein
MEPESRAMELVPKYKIRPLTVYWPIVGRINRVDQEYLE